MRTGSIALGSILLALIACAQAPDQQGLSAELFPAVGGYIDRDGRLRIPQQFTSAGLFTENLAPVQVGKRWAYIDKRGCIVIGARFDDAWLFGEGLAPVRVGDKLGYIDPTGEWAIPPKYDPPKGLEYIPDFWQGFAMVRIGGEHAFINRSGALLPEQFREAEPFQDGLAAVKVNDGWGFIDHAGKLVVPPRFDWTYGFSEGLAYVRAGRKDVVIDNAGKALSEGYIDTAGNVAFRMPTGWGNGMAFKEGLAPASFRDKMGYLDRAGHVAIQPKFRVTLGFVEGLAPSFLGDSCGYIDHQGEFAVKPRFTHCRHFSGGLAFVVEKGSKRSLFGSWSEVQTVGYITPAGEYVWLASSDSRHWLLLALRRIPFQLACRLGL